MSFMAIGADGTVKIIDRKGLNEVDFATEYFGDAKFEACSMPTALQQVIGADDLAVGAYVQVDDGPYNVIATRLFQCPIGGNALVWDDNDKLDNLHKLKKHIDEVFGPDWRELDTVEERRAAFFADEIP